MSIEFARKMSLAYNLSCKSLCQELKLPQTAFDILMFLANNPNYKTASDIVEIRKIKANLVSVNVDRLVQEGYLQRQAVEGDRRKTELLCTPKAQPVIEKGRGLQQNFMERLLADSVRFASFRYPYVIDSICANRPAALAGLQAGDSIMQLDGKNIAYFDFKEEMLRRQKADSASHYITLTYARAGVIDTITFATDSIYEIGVVVRTATNQLLPVVKKEYSFLASFPAGAALGVQTLKGYVGQMKYLFSKEGAKQLGGFGTIGSIFPATWDWHQFWYMTAFLSIILAFMNILPIPALDGGHVLFLIYEIVARRKPSDKFMERAQMVGMFLLFGLLLWANFNDILRFLF